MGVKGIVTDLKNNSIQGAVIQVEGVGKYVNTSDRYSLPTYLDIQRFVFKAENIMKYVNPHISIRKLG